MEKQREKEKERASEKDEERKAGRDRETENIYLNSESNQ